MSEDVMGKIVEYLAGRSDDCLVSIRQHKSYGVPLRSVELEVWDDVYIIENRVFREGWWTEENAAEVGDMVDELLGEGKRCPSSRRRS